jgi:hypothetical protein
MAKQRSARWEWIAKRQREQKELRKQQGDVGNHEIVSTGKSGNERTGVSGDGE